MSKKTVQLIIESGNHYLIKIKKNQGRLHRRIYDMLDHCMPLDTACFQENNRGRFECRNVSVYGQPTSIDREWHSIKSVIFIRRHGIRAKATYDNDGCYISSRTFTARQFADIIRKHWHIENRLHWVKDVNFNEDKSLIKSQNPAQNLSLLQTMAINLYRVNGHQSIKTATTYFTNKVDILLKFLRT